MKYVLFLILSCNFLFSATLLSLSASEDGGKIDVTLSFDSPYEGSIEQSMSPKGPILYISEASIESGKEVSFKSGLVKKIILSKVAPTRALLQIESDSPLSIEAQKSGDNQKLEFIITSAQAKKDAQTPYDKQKSEQFSKSFSESFDQSREAKSSDDMYWRYVVVIAFMALLLIVLIVVKKRYAKVPMQAKTKTPRDASEYAERSSERRSGTETFTGVERSGDRRYGGDPYADFAAKDDSFERPSRRDTDELQIISQKAVDSNNKLVAVEYDGDKYLLVIGQNTTIIDKTATDKRAKEFEETFLKNDRRLEGYLSSRPLSKLDLYKARAEGD